MTADTPGRIGLADPAAIDILDTPDATPKAIRGSVVRTGAFVANLLVSLVAVPFMIRHLGPVDYGMYVTVSSIVFIIGGVTEGGLTNFGIRELAVLEPHHHEHFLRNLVGLRLALTAAGVSIGVAVTWATGAAPEVVAGTAIVGFGLMIGLAQQTFVIPLQAQLRLGTVSGLSLLSHGILNGIFIALVVVGAGLASFFWANVVASVIAVAVTLLLVYRQAPSVPRIDLAVWKRIVRETLPYAIAAAVGLIYFRIAVILMSYVSTAHETGIFSAAFRIAEVIAVIPWLLVSSLFPILARAARDDHARLDYGLQKIFDVSLIVGTGLTLMLVVGAQFAIDVVAGPGFGDSVPVLRIQAIALITGFLVATWLFALLSLKHFRQILIGNLIAAAAAIVGTLALAPPLGAEGAAIATVAAEAVLVASSYFFVRRARPDWRLQLGVVPKIGVGAIVGLAAAVALSAWPPWLLAGIAGLLFAGVILATRAVPPEVFDALRRRRSDPVPAPDEP